MPTLPLFTKYHLSEIWNLGLFTTTATTPISLISAFFYPSVKTRKRYYLGDRFSIPFLSPQNSKPQLHNSDEVSAK
ncbi:hypothetical protein HW132_10500 [Brasilonema sp. CT11]|nr:hypothetical protein [Brasilonema sp. CT11]